MQMKSRPNVISWLNIMKSEQRARIEDPEQTPADAITMLMVTIMIRVQ
jgi:hypothetical protein